ncbi:hypothetical protein ACHAW5_009327 [Stephanodiscus triporus]|uniref:CMP/dCMP-type deaminase domain-containing protein n=1 Tax=Stephanodiscus triporus TaxID=2934178 RepID=A0ABD3PFT0_9STRA
MFRYHLVNTALNCKNHRAHSILYDCAMLSSRSRECFSDQPSAATDSVARGPLAKFELHGYRPSKFLSDDENYMDIVMIITRSSMLRQGSMGCILVRPNTTAGGERRVGNDDSQQHDDDHGDDVFGRIIAAATNTSLFQTNDSDVHAEINAIGQVARRRHFSQSRESARVNIAEVSTLGATAYITMPPCKRCFGALHASGIQRIVSRKEHPSLLREAAREVGMYMSCLTQQQLADQKVRLGRLFAHTSVDSVALLRGQALTSDDALLFHTDIEGNEKRK